MKLYINNGVPSRREKLENHLKNVGFDGEICWNTHFTVDDPYVKWLHSTYCRHMSIGSISGLVKHIDSFYNCKDDYQMFADDDVLFPIDWKAKLGTLKKKDVNVISLGVNYHVHPDSGLTFTGNIGGMECFILSKQFIEFFLNNIDFGQAFDIVIGAMMCHLNIPLEITPICQQTSILEHTTSTGKPTVFEKDWKTYTREYKPSGLKYSHIKEEFQKFMIVKNKVEEDLKDRFNVTCDIWNLEYIYTRYSII